MVDETKDPQNGDVAVKPKAVIHFEGWVNKVDGTKVPFNFTSEPVPLELVEKAGIPKQEEQP